MINRIYRYAPPAFVCILLCLSCAVHTISRATEMPETIVGAARLEAYLPVLKGKRVALLINQTSRVNEVSLLDTLLHSGVNITKIFVPEHGFRGTADAGAHIRNDRDPATELPVISLYGNNKKPDARAMSDIDVLIYDLQDVGVRFYTYISTLEYVMEACAEHRKTLIVLDRPNPNRHIVDGPVLDTALRSFVGMQPIPVLYGMTAGEYALMLKGEQWAKGTASLELSVIPCLNYPGNTPYVLPVPPSPNLKNMAAIYLYPGLCFFEGTCVSVGRGTAKPFQQWGHPDFKPYFSYYFVPKRMEGASQPLLENRQCYGILLAEDAATARNLVGSHLNIDFLIDAYRMSADKTKFFNTFFEKLAGTKLLRQQIVNGVSRDEIRASWNPDLEAFKQIRRKYLLYKDEAFIW